MVASGALLMSANQQHHRRETRNRKVGTYRPRAIPPLQCRRGKTIGTAAAAERVNGPDGQALEVLIAVVFGQNLIILLSQLQPLLNLTLV
jgi:hypothetical protein